MITITTSKIYQVGTGFELCRRPRFSPVAKLPVTPWKPNLIVNIVHKLPQSPVTIQLLPNTIKV